MPAACRGDRQAWQPLRPRTPQRDRAEPTPTHRSSPKIVHNRRTIASVLYMASEGAAESVAVEAFGVTVAVTADPQHFAAVRDFLPPGARPARRPPERGHFALVKDADDALLRVMYDEQSVAGPVELQLALGVLDAQLRMHIALHAPDHVFVHAGVVGVGGRAIVLPGKSFAGKT